MRYRIAGIGAVTALRVSLALTLCSTFAPGAAAEKNAVPYVYDNAIQVRRHFSVVTSVPELNITWDVTVPEILSRQLENGQFIESSRTSGLYPNCFPRNVYPDVLLRCGYFEEVERYLEFMWKNQKDDGSFWNYFDMRGKGAGIVEEDGGAYIIWQSYLYYLHTKNMDFLERHWKDLLEAMALFERLRSPETGLFYANAGYAEGTIKGGYDVYHQSITVLASRSAAAIARILGKLDEADRWARIAEELPGLVRTHLSTEDEGRFVFQKRGDGTTNDKPYPACLVLGYFDVLDPMDEMLSRTVDYVRNGPLFGKYSDLIFGFEGIELERVTGSGFWIGQAGHGWIIPYLLRKGDLEEAGVWLRSMAACRDRETNLIPEHINWAGFDPDGGAWQATGDVFGVLPSPTAWVDPGNLYSMGTAIRALFFIVDSRMEGAGPFITLRVPPTLASLSASDIQTPAGYATLLYAQDERDITISLSGDGEGSVRILHVHEGKPAVTRDGEPYPQAAFSDAPPAVTLTTDLSPHTFTLSWER